MAYIKPGTLPTGNKGVSSDSDYLAVDLTVPKTGTGAATISATGLNGAAVQATKAGFGVVDPYTGEIEILDALPLGRAAVQLKVEGSANDVNFATQDFLTATEVDASTVLDSEFITADLT